MYMTFLSAMSSPPFINKTPNNLQEQRVNSRARRLLNYVWSIGDRCLYLSHGKHYFVIIKVFGFELQILDNLETLSKEGQSSWTPYKLGLHGVCVECHRKQFSSSTTMFGPLNKNWKGWEICRELKSRTLEIRWLDLDHSNIEPTYH